MTRVFDVGRLESGAPYIVMEMLEGADLKRVLEVRGTLPAVDAARHLSQACEALAEAHAQGIVHRDLKPANLYLCRGPASAPPGTIVVKVLDFGWSWARSIWGTRSRSIPAATCSR